MERGGLAPLWIHRARFPGASGASVTGSRFLAVLPNPTGFRDSMKSSTFSGLTDEILRRGSAACGLSSAP